MGDKNILQRNRCAFWDCFDPYRHDAMMLFIEPCPALAIEQCKIELLKILKPISEYRRGGQRPARLYRFAAARFEKLKDKGILFPF